MLKVGKIFDFIKPKEELMCAIVGVAAVHEVAGSLRKAAHKQQHRSHRSAGMTTYDADTLRYYRERGIGTLTEVFTEERLRQVKGKIGIAHLRWATQGGLIVENIHPLEGTFNGRPFFIAHNGEISFRRDLEGRFRNYQPDVTADTKFILGLIEESRERNFEAALQYAFGILKGTYSLVILHENTLYVVRDVTGNRPLYVGRRKDAVCAVSESSAFRVLGIRPEDTREVEAGEMVIIHGEDLSMESKSIQSPVDIPRVMRLCLIELMYSMYPTTIIFGRTIRKIREQLGWRLAQTYSPDADIVVGVPDSGLDAARGFARGSGIPYKEGLRRYHQSGRLFYYDLEEREDRYFLKYDPDQEILNGRKPVLIDDTMFASGTMQNVMEVCVEAGAEEIHVGIPAPMITSPCYYGTPTSSGHRRLIAKDHHGNLQGIQKEIGARFGDRLKSIAFLSLGEARRAVVETEPFLPGYDHIVANNVCDACFLGGTRHIPVDIDTS